jgi:hypothetical protein
MFFAHALTIRAKHLVITHIRRVISSQVVSSPQSHRERRVRMPLVLSLRPPRLCGELRVISSQHLLT